MGFNCYRIIDAIIYSCSAKPSSYYEIFFVHCRGKESEFVIEPELTLELMMAANYLHM